MFIFYCLTICAIKAKQMQCSRHFLQAKNCVAVQQKIITFAYSSIVLRSFRALYFFLCFSLPSCVKQCIKLLFFSCGTRSNTELQSIHVLENCGFSWIRREDDVTVQVSHKPSVPLIICQKCDSVRFRFLKHSGISVMFTTACTLLLSFVLNITVTSACHKVLFTPTYALSHTTMY
jgi:hypothetical protein